VKTPIAKNQSIAYTEIHSTLIQSTPYPTERHPMTDALGPNGKYHHDGEYVDYDYEYRDAEFEMPIVKSEAGLKTDSPITDPNATAARDKEKYHLANSGNPENTKRDPDSEYSPPTPEQAQARWNQWTEQDINKANGYEGATDPLSGECEGFSKKANQRINDLKGGQTLFDKENNPVRFNQARDAAVNVATKALAKKLDITPEQAKLEIMQKHRYELGYSDDDMANAERLAKESVADAESPDIILM
jgi:hypothetical protein